MGYWIFQFNPRISRTLDYLRDHPAELDWWHISRYRDQIKPGDIAFIWKSKGGAEQDDRGVYATAVVVSTPPHGEPYGASFWEESDETAKGYWADAGEAARLGKYPRVVLAHSRVLLGRPVTAEVVENTPGLEDLSILLHPPHQGIYRLTDEQGRRIQALVQASG
jgi:hypothetical protein